LFVSTQAALAECEGDWLAAEMLSGNFSSTLDRVVTHDLWANFDKFVTEPMKKHAAGQLAPWELAISRRKCRSWYAVCFVVVLRPYRRVALENLPIAPFRRMVGDRDWLTCDDANTTKTRNVGVNKTATTKKTKDVNATFTAALTDLQKFAVMSWVTKARYFVSGQKATEGDLLLPATVEVLAKRKKKKKDLVESESLQYGVAELMRVMSKNKLKKVNITTLRKLLATKTSGRRSLARALSLSRSFSLCSCVSHLLPCSLRG
jgi:hypothetical protein